MIRTILFADLIGPAAPTTGSHGSGDRLSAAAAGAALLAVASALVTAELAATHSDQPHATAPMAMAAAPASGAVAGATNGTDGVDTSRREWALGAYGGVTYTHPSTVRISGGAGTEMTIADFEWMGMPFKSPVYYGARIQRWSQGRFGGMVDFTHAKAIAVPDDRATLTGTRHGAPLPPEAAVREIFSKLEFSHGHNMLTLNGLVRLTPSWMRVRPYVGAGGGVSLPHTEIGFAGDGERTYEYQYAGLVGQALGGIEIQLGRASVFLEYKFSYAPYDVPLSHRTPGWLLVTDVWQQIGDWWAGRRPPGGRATVQLDTHHAIGGILVKNGSVVGSQPH